jgi:hypothetical protein
MAIIAPDHVLDQRSSCEYLREIAHVDPTAARIASEKCSASSIGCTPTRLPMTVPRGIGCVPQADTLIYSTWRHIIIYCGGDLFCKSI